MRNMSVKIVKCRIQGVEHNGKIQKLKFLILGFGFSLYLLNFALHCYAAPCYGTRMPKQKEFAIGMQTYNIFRRYLEEDFGKLRSTQHFFLLSWGLCDWLSIDLKVGTGNIKQRPTNHCEVDYSSNFAGGYGFRLKLAQKDKLKTVFGFQHISVHPKSIYVDGLKNRAVLDDWQVGLLGSYDFKKLIPYIGSRWSRLDYIHWQGDSRKRRMSDLTKGVGLICGLDVPLREKVWINLEIQAFDSQAAAFSINYSF
ncbi:MAG: hypothetical protein NC908_01695 [Candidatus Omnitrophica bacterium]|nr:hypothetical protein [Candidatus Omnitrophota bacterium]